MSDRRAQLMVQISYLLLAYFALIMFIQAKWMLRYTFSSLKETFIIIDIVLFTFLIADTIYFIFRERKRSQALKIEGTETE